MTLMAIETTIQYHIGGCREWCDDIDSICGEPSEYVLWGKLIPAEGLGPRCYDHAAKHVGHDALRSGSTWALINVRDLARELRNPPRKEEENVNQ